MFIRFFHLWLFGSLVGVAAAEFRVGVATVDVTPDYPVRLSGYAARKTESEGVLLPIKAKAAALSEGESTALFITVDNVGIPHEMWLEVTRRIEREHSIPAERVVILSSHTHSAPALTGAINNLFVEKLPSDQQATIDRYTRELTDKLVSVAGLALKELQPVKLHFGKGRVSFAKNRRTEGGPVDHDLPVLVARGADGKARWALANYACHCTTLGGGFNQIHGDWAGVAQASLEKSIPGVTAMVAIGCGADSNPSPRGNVENAVAHGEELAREVGKLLDLQLEPITSELEFHARDFELPFEPLPTSEEWEKRAKEQGIVGYHARQNLERLDRGEKLPTALPYRVQTWNFGRELAMVFLPGEVVVDYALRLKNEFDSDRLWVSGYANWVPCYIPSVRILKEGGYEAESSLWYYDRPARLSTNTESLIISAVHELVPKSFQVSRPQSNFPPPKSPTRSLAAIRTEPELKVELVAAEPLIASPVAIDWSADGKLWIVEMRDFPSGMDGRFSPGGSVAILEDRDGDGAMDHRTTFLEDIPFPTGITCWNGGALVCAAPDILFAKDTNGDGKADDVRKLFSGFGTDNYQARVNSLSLGLDGWFYGANGLIGGQITGGALEAPMRINNRDFRFRPNTGEFETASGLTQQGRVRDDFGNWFGCDNSTLIWHYPLLEQHLRRNPHVAPEATRVAIAVGADPNRLFPISETQERFNEPQHANRATAVCGLGIYRDELLGAEFYGNAFACEPVHNLVRRMVLTQKGATFSAIKPASEQNEFLASQDSWFRPVQVRTGPDGALWIVDMYRMVVEHPRWITPERLKDLDLRAGAEMGRIYRVLPRAQPARPIADLEKLDGPALVAQLNSPNGTERDRVQLEIIKRKDPALAAGIKKVVDSDSSPQVQVQALSTLNALDPLKAEAPLLSALNFPDAEVRAFAISLCEQRPGSPAIQRKLTELADDPSDRVRFQLGGVLGNFTGQASTQALIALFKRPGDSWMRSVLLSSVPGRALEIAEALDTPDPRIIRTLVETALRENPEAHARLLNIIARAGDDLQVWQLEAIRAALQSDPDASPAMKKLLVLARGIAADQDASVTRRVAAIRALAAPRADSAGELLLGIFKTGDASGIAAASAEALVTRGELRAAYDLWPTITPNSRRALTAAVLRKPNLVPAHLQFLTEQNSLAELPFADRQQLLRSSNSAIRGAAERLFPSKTSSRAEVLAQYESINSSAANAARGGELFATHCASCHHFRGMGFPLGPNLAALTDRSAPFLLRAILDPNDALENRYLNYSVETDFGDSVTGIIADENPSSITIANASGLRQVVLRKDIAKIIPMQLSLMPEGMEQLLPPAEMADLIAFLQFTPASFGTATLESASGARAAFQETASPIKIIAASETLPYSSWAGSFPLNHCRQTDGKSRIEWESTARTNALGEAIFEFPVAFGFVSQPRGTFTLFIDGQPALSFDATTADEQWENADRSVRASYLVMDRNSEDSSGILKFRVNRRLLKSEKASFTVRGSATGSMRWFGIYDLSDTRTARN